MILPRKKEFYMKKRNIGLAMIFGLLLVSCGTGTSEVDPSITDPSEITYPDKDGCYPGHCIPTDNVTVVKSYYTEGSHEYYMKGITNFDELEGDELKEALYTHLNATRKLQNYGVAWVVIKKADKVVKDGKEYVRGIYSRNLIPLGNQQYDLTFRPNFFNREHSVPKSFLKNSDKDESDTGKIGAATDIFNIFPEDTYVNDQRGTMKYGEAGVNVLTFIQDSVGRETDAKIDVKKGIIEPTDLAKGEVARANLYMLLMYPQYLNVGESGALDMFLRWNLEHQPTLERDVARNEAVYEYQKNRNPFIDDPALACKIWGDYDDTTRAVCGV